MEIISPTIRIGSNYGFDHNWTLIAYGRQFYLGQDVKFCSRVLGQDTSHIVARIGSNDLSKPSTKHKLAMYIMKELGLNQENISQLEPWALCAE